jgi:hypothetical protein
LPGVRMIYEVQWFVPMVRCCGGEGLEAEGGEIYESVRLAPPDHR